MGIFILSFFFLFSNPVEFSIDSCYYYWGILEDDKKLIAYLDKTKNNLSSDDKIYHDYYLARYYRVQERRKEAVNIVLKRIRKIEDEKTSVNDTMYFKYLDEMSLLYNRGGFEDREKGLNCANKSIRSKQRLNASRDEFGKSYYCKYLLFEKSKNKYPAYSDSTLFYLQKAREYYTDETEQMRLLNSICLLKLQRKEFDGVEEDIDSIISFRRKIESNNTYPQVLKIRYWLASENYDSAKNGLDSLMNVFRKEGNHLNKNELISLYLNLAVAQNDPVAALRWKDSLGFENSLTTQPEFKDLIENAELKIDLEDGAIRRAKQKVWLIVLSFFSILLGITWFARSAYLRQKNLKVIADLEKSKLEAELHSVRAEMHGEQRERQAIASTLHDHMASLLTAADLHLSVASKGKNVEGSVAKAKSILKDVNQQVRSLSHQLVSPSLMKYGLVPALETFLNGFQSEDLKISFESNLGDMRLDESKEVFIYRSCAELAQNVQKHSNADILEVKLEIDKDVISLQFLDNGKTDKTIVDWGFGLSNIQKRAQAHGGDLQINFEPNGCIARLNIKI